MKNRKYYVIRQLNSLGVYTGVENKPLELLNYETLKCMLAVKRAMAQ